MLFEMAAVVGKGFNLFHRSSVHGQIFMINKSCKRLQALQPFSISHTVFLKEIHRTEETNKIVIEGVRVKSDRDGRVVSMPGRSGCPLCKLGLKNIRHTDILILNQFVESTGQIIPKEVTGLCNKQHFRIKRAISLAQTAGLLPKPLGRPLFGDWEKYNTYYKKF